MKHYSEYFNGNKISDYGLQHKRVDYYTLARSYSYVLNNNIMHKTYDIGYWEQESGLVDNYEEIEEIRERIEELMLEDADGNREQIEELGNEIEELEEEQEYYPDIYQYYIVSDNFAELLKEINEIVFYNDELDMYVWGVTHWGTSWDYVLTDIEICEYEK